MNKKKMKVLIVEDNPGDAFLIEEMLRDLKLELEITLAKDGQEALDILVAGRNGVPGLVILDLNLPKVDGFGVLRYMNEKPTLSSIPVVVMTGSLRKEDEKRSRELGAVDYCIKPATADEMESTIICLRRNLELLPTKGRGNHLGPNAKTNLGHFPLHAEDWQIPPPCSDRLIMDVLNSDPWNMWK
jgi:CheY-like chemotaxis protein